MSLGLTGLERQPGAALISPAIPSSLELIKHARLHQESAARTAMFEIEAGPSFSSLSAAVVRAAGGTTIFCLNLQITKKKNPNLLNTGV